MVKAGINNSLLIILIIPLRLFPKFTLLPASAKLIFPTLVSDGLACKNYMEETECVKTSHRVG